MQLRNKRVNARDWKKDVKELSILLFFSRLNIYTRGENIHSNRSESLYLKEEFVMEKVTQTVGAIVIALVISNIVINIYEAKQIMKARKESKQS